MPESARRSENCWSPWDGNPRRSPSPLTMWRYAKPDLPACLILDVELPDINGLEFQRQLIE